MALMALQAFLKPKWLNNTFVSYETYPNDSKILRIPKIDQTFVQIGPILEKLWPPQFSAQCLLETPPNLDKIQLALIKMDTSIEFDGACQVRWNH